MEQTKEILRQLLQQKKLGYFSRRDIDTVVKEVRGVLDQRSLNNWFNYLFDLKFILPLKPNIYNINVQKIAELEISIPPQIDPKQRRLF